jgi:hypothetical protein
MESRWNPTQYEAPPKEPLTTPVKSASGELPAPDSARARAMKFEQLAVANKPPEPEPGPTSSGPLGFFDRLGWSNRSAPAEPTTSRSKPASLAGTPRPTPDKPARNPDKPALVLWTNATSPRASETGPPSPVKSPSKIRRNSFGTPAPPTPDSALGKVKQYEENVQAHNPAPPEPTGKGWVEEDGHYKKEHAPLPPKKQLEELP